MQLIFNDIGGGEVVLILIFILIFFGAKSIPSLARTFGRTIRQVREASADIQDEIRKSGDEMKKDLNLQGTIREAADDIRRPLDQYAADLEDSMKYQPPKRPSHIKPMGHNPKEVEAPASDAPESDTTESKKVEKAESPQKDVAEEKNGNEEKS